MNHMKITRCIAVLTLIAAILGLTSLICSACLFAKKPAPISVLDVNPGKHYRSVNELTAAAAAIVQVKVGSSKAILDQGSVYTLSEANVLRVFKGQLAIESQVSILETGGLMAQNSVSMDVQPDGMAVMQPDETYILFLDQYRGALVQQAYEPLGIYQGKFRIDKNVIIQQAPTAEKLTEQPPQIVVIFTAQIAAALINERIASTSGIN
jgi:hypothetical protein